MDITLKNLLFAEAAPTAKQALQSGIAAIGGKDLVVLLSFDRASRILQKYQKPTEQVRLWNALATQAIVGFLEFSRLETDLFSVELSAGVNKYGILAYQLAMYTINMNGQNWLVASHELSEDSWGVWQKMFMYSNKNGQNVYRAKWLGDWRGLGAQERLVEALETAAFRIDSREFSRRVQKIIAKDLVSEKEVTAALGIYAEKCGNLWAYRLSRRPAQAEKMFVKGRELLTLGTSIVSNDISHAGTEFFHRLYNR
jgi:hypothetical protein